MIGEKQMSVVRYRATTAMGIAAILLTVSAWCTPMAQAQETAPASDDTTQKQGTTVTPQRKEDSARKDPWWENEGQSDPAAPQASEGEPATSASDTGAEPATDVATVPVNTQEPQEPVASGETVLDDIVVTSQKRVQSAKDVPISISVLDEKFITEKGIVDLREAMLFVPNVKVEAAGFFAAPRARGFSFNNNNKAIEPPLGIAIDGFPYTTPTYFSSAVFDINRIEVLRGPQGTTFGKNTTAGLIHIITNDPSSDWNGVLDLQGGELGRQRIEFAGGGPLIEDVVDFRIAVLSNERATQPATREEKGKRR